MNTAIIQQEIIKLLKSYEGRSISPSPVTLSTKLSEDLDIDSARLVDIILDVEAKFEVTVDDASMAKLQTVGDLVEVVDSQIKVSKSS
jgi:acyl carrier protein